MKQLRVGDILKCVKELQDKGMTIGEVAALPVYIGDDDELNGIHCAWYTQMIDSNNQEGDDQEFAVIINENRNNIKLDGRAILIS